MSPVHEQFDIMGSFLSRRSLHPPTPTAKLVVFQEDAAAAVFIRDFPKPVKVAEIIRESPGFFVCHADAMCYDEYVSPLSVEHELQMDDLYFLLPVTKLRHPLSASEMAALAVKVSAAMNRRSRRSRQTHIFSSPTAGVGNESMQLQRMNGPGRKRHDVSPCGDAAMRIPRMKLRTIDEKEEAFTY